MTGTSLMPVSGKSKNAGTVVVKKRNRNYAPKLRSRGSIAVSAENATVVYKPIYISFKIDWPAALCIIGFIVAL